ncbi:hypothetical protein RQP46_002099 [Phenoliferia psychrophenolica]
MDMSGMDMGSSNSTSDATTEAACKISMLWNWYTVDACFISPQWHIRSVGGYAGTVIGVFFIVVALECFRRFGREYDRAIKAAHLADQVQGKGDSDAVSVPAPFYPTYKQQGIRAALYGVQFGTGYMLMLLAMYYNGGIILAIFAGATAGYFVSARDTVGEFEAPGVRGDCCAA